MIWVLAGGVLMVVFVWGPPSLQSKERLRAVQARDNRTILGLLKPSRTQDVDIGVVLDMAGAALGAGISIPTMLRALAAALPDTEVAKTKTKPNLRGLNDVANSLLMGASWTEAWEDTSAAFIRLREALEPAWLDGAAPVPLLERSTATLRASRHRLAQEAAARLGAKLALPLGLCFLPAFIFIGILPVVAAAGLAIFG